MPITVRNDRECQLCEAKDNRDVVCVAPCEKCSDSAEEIRICKKCMIGHREALRAALEESK